MTGAANGLYAGLISGTSVDAIDAVLARFDPTPRLLATLSHAWPAALRERIVGLARNDIDIKLRELGELDGLIAEQFAAAIRQLLQQAGIPAAEVRAIGSHGQTICHLPDATPPFTLQLGSPARIAEFTGIDTVADFRQADMAAGGQGAPLLPVLHQKLLADPKESRVVLNLGGIANITVLVPGLAVTGFDTGPANGLMDAWTHRCLGKTLDTDGEWARQGHVDPALLSRCLDDPYFRLAPPKSTGREYFNLDWLQQYLPPAPADVDVQATLLELSVASIRDAIRAHAPGTDRVIACGGGIHNGALMESLGKALSPTKLETTASHGIDPDFVEATAFAWLARQNLLGLSGNLPSVTGARGPRVLGCLARAPAHHAD